MEDQEYGATLEYSKAKGQYHVEEIRGRRPTAAFQRSTGVPDQGDLAVIVQVETITVHVGDWLSEGEAEALGALRHLIVRPYRLTHERPAEEDRGKRAS